MISEGHKANFNTLELAFYRGDICLMECTDKKTGEPIPVICAISKTKDDPKDDVNLVPLAKMFLGNPYEEVDPPT